jgi:hypothetical protein
MYSASLNEKVSIRRATHPIGTDFRPASAKREDTDSRLLLGGLILHLYNLELIDSFSPPMPPRINYN